MSKKAVFGLVASESNASDIVEDLHSADFSNDDISVLASDRSGGRESRDYASRPSRAAESVTAGGAGNGGGNGNGGSGSGGALSWINGIESRSVAGAGNFMASGPVGAALGRSSGNGGLATALTTIGIPEQQARRCENRIRQGHVLVAVRAGNPDEVARAREILQDGGAEDVACSDGSGGSAREDSRDRGSRQQQQNQQPSGRNQNQGQNQGQGRPNQPSSSKNPSRQY